MDKESILAKARQENKGTDEREKQVQVKAGQIAFTVGAVVSMLITLFNNILRMVDHTGKLYDPKLTTAPWSIYLLMLGGLFLYKYIKLRQKHELIYSIFMLTVGFGCLVILALQMVGVL